MEARIQTRQQSEVLMTTRMLNAFLRLRNDLRGQDLIEYSLIAGFVAVAAGAIFPTTLMPAVSKIFSTLENLFGQAANQG
jgi:Flp pilus assembly pilin Flp